MLRRAIAALVGKMAHEPVMLLGLGIMFLETAQKGFSQGLGPEDAFVGAGVAVLTFLARELVVPTRKLKDANVALDTEEPGEPFAIFDDEDPA